MGKGTMTGLALVHVKYAMELNFDEIIIIFAGRRPVECC